MNQLNGKCSNNSYELEEDDEDDALKAFESYENDSEGYSM